MPFPLQFNMKGGDVVVYLPTANMGILVTFV